MNKPKAPRYYDDPEFTTADTELGRAFAIVDVTQYTRLRTGRYATRNDVVDALVERGVPMPSTDLVDQILRHVNNR